MLARTDQQVFVHGREQMGTYIFGSRMSFPTRQLDYRCKLWELMVTYAKGTVFQCGLIKYGESSLSLKKNTKTRKSVLPSLS